jgi:pilus assembly protein CpaB
MTRRRRAAVLIGLSIIMGALAASNVSGREAALRREVGPAVPVLVARTGVAAGTKLAPATLAVRQVPARYAPAGAYRSATEVAGLRAAVAIPAGADLDPSLLDDGTAPAGPAGPALRTGERVARVVAIGPGQTPAPGARVDVLVTREGSGDRAGSTTLALEDVEVLSAGRAPEAGGSGPDAGLPRIALDLRVSVRQAVYLAAAQSFARELRVLPRAAGDRRHGVQGLRIGSGL